VTCSRPAGLTPSRPWSSSKPHAVTGRRREHVRPVNIIAPQQIAWSATCCPLTFSYAGRQCNSIAR
jgi:hypothetical protein